jgi:hypothetical protein
MKRTQIQNINFLYVTKTLIAIKQNATVVELNFIRVAANAMPAK